MLTKRQKEILDFLESFTTKKGYSPSFEEIRRRLKLASVSTVHFHISKLKDGGYLGKVENKARAISIASKDLMVKIPLLGNIAAGEPIEAIRQKEFIAFPKSKLPVSGNFYALRVIGNSMIDENIRDGDIVLVKQQQVGENKQGATTVITDYKTRLKRFQKRQEKTKQRMIKKLLKRKWCPICNKKEDPDGRCKCVNKDAW
jgi:repressor LexA